ncbi:hypothetical protein F5B17DRAFT_382640 [Nemania serpens]|nr:hypothetical protein F5B17DRAFT_382640 [Nemania serpens]
MVVMIFGICFFLDDITICVATPILYIWTALQLAETLRAIFQLAIVRTYLFQKIAIFIPAVINTITALIACHEAIPCTYYLKQRSTHPTSRSQVSLE